MSPVVALQVWGFLLKRFFSDEKGQGMVEYALILVLVSLFLVAALTALGGQISQFFQNVGNQL